jgi:Raf kinase inhibitor-like YbhB/YbcL family protein
MKSVLAMTLVLLACGHEEDGAKTVAEPEMPGVGKLVVSSPAFAAGAELPIDHTCEGANVAPALAWSGAPAGTKSFALIVDDPDAPDPSAPKRTWVHWVLVNIPADVTSLGAGAGINPPPGAANGNNDWKKPEWGGPCPPIGRHRYFFKVYAIDGVLGKPGMTKAELLAAIKGHVLAKGELIGTYQKRPK